MDWSALAIGLVGSVVGAAAGVVAVLIQSDAEVDREERAARREFRMQHVRAMRSLLERSEQYLSSMFQRTLWDSTEATRRQELRELGLTDQQIAAARTIADDVLAPFPTPAEVIREFSGTALALEDQELANHSFLIQMELAASHPPGFLEPQQIRFLVVRTNQLLERYASTVPVFRRAFIQRMKRALGVKGRWENVPKEWEFGSLERLKAEIETITPSGKSADAESLG